MGFLRIFRGSYWSRNQTMFKCKIQSSVPETYWIYISTRWRYVKLKLGSSVQLLSHVWLFATPLTAANLASLPITNSRNLLKLMSIESVMPSIHVILWHPLLLLPSIFSSIRVLSSQSVLLIWWPKYQSFRFSISLSNEYSGLTLG